MKEPRQKLSEAVKDLLSQGHSVELSAYGRSMIPFLHPGQKVKLTPTELSLIVRGDLVAFHKQDYLVVHRVHDVHSLNGAIQLITKGDSNLNPDAPVTSENYLAKVSGVYRRGMWRTLSPTSFHSRLVLRLGKGYSIWFWVWKRFRY
jgi:signal peptidase I